MFKGLLHKKGAVSVADKQPGEPGALSIGLLPHLQGGRWLEPLVSAFGFDNILRFCSSDTRVCNSVGGGPARLLCGI